MMRKITLEFKDADAVMDAIDILDHLIAFAQDQGVVEEWEANVAGSIATALEHNGGRVGSRAAQD